ncbi:MAG: putative membrane protein [Parcubacteria group bacterium Athens0714_25]|nr:MAG: putative membrane protein [Parcubacteria group bacterium Athens0714_25]
MKIFQKLKIKLDRRLLYYFAILAAVFGFSIWQGYYSAKQNPEEANLIGEELSSQLEFLKNTNSFALFLIIFLNNYVKSLAVLLLGSFFGAVPFLMIWFNGSILGILIFVLRSGIVEGKVAGGAEIFWSLFPHGIFEVPAFLLAGACGVWLGEKFYRKLKSKETFKPNLNYCLEIFIKIVTPFLFLAALIETFITPIIVSLLG